MSALSAQSRQCPRCSVRSGGAQCWNCGCVTVRRTSAAGASLERSDADGELRAERLYALSKISGKVNSRSGQSLKRKQSHDKWRGFVRGKGRKPAATPARVAFGTIAESDLCPACLWVSDVDVREHGDSSASVRERELQAAGFVRGDQGWHRRCATCARAMPRVSAILDSHELNRAAGWRPGREVVASPPVAVVSGPVAEWTCESCGDRYAEAKLINGRTPCCFADARVQRVADSYERRLLEQACAEWSEQVSRA